MPGARALHKHHAPGLNSADVGDLGAVVHDILGARVTTKNLHGVVALGYELCEGGAPLALNHLHATHTHSGLQHRPTLIGLPAGLSRALCKVDAPASQTALAPEHALRAQNPLSRLLAGLVVELQIQRMVSRGVPHQVQKRVGGPGEGRAQRLQGRAVKRDGTHADAADTHCGHAGRPRPVHAPVLDDHWQSSQGKGVAEHGEGAWTGQQTASEMQPSNTTNQERNA